MLLYLTHNDAPSGVYWSQVTDVVGHLNQQGNERVRLVALVSARGWWRSRKAIRERCPDAIVLPQWPGVRNWKRNLGLLAVVCRMLRPTGVIARGVFATWYGLRLREQGLVRKVCFDGRGAYAAEWEEYRVVDDEGMIAAMRPLEQEAVRASDFRFAVSEALVAHWRERYGYTGHAHVVIPCTLGQDHLLWLEMTPGELRDRQLWERTEDEVVLVYSGSAAGWQSFAALRATLEKALREQPRLVLLFLSKPDPVLEELTGRFPGRVHVHWMPPKHVPAVLDTCHAALLVREDTLTNRVASPTKFAEYLAAGLPVLISPHLGDFSTLVERERLGQVVAPGEQLPPLHKSEPAERARLKRLAKERFTKGAYDGQYLRVLGSLIP